MTYREEELPKVVSVYSLIDCSQFKGATAEFIHDAKTQEILNNQAKEEEEKKQKEEKERQKREEENTTTQLKILSVMKVTIIMRKCSSGPRLP